jgi:cell division septal protein FtsQ
MSVYAPTDKRFRRSHVRPARRRRSAEARQRLLRGLGVLAAVSLSVYWTPKLVRQSALIQIGTISVEGNQRLAVGEVLALLEDLRGQNILLADLDAARARLLTSGWVRSATLRRLLPSTIEIRIEERTPIGLGRFDGRLYLVDGEGTVIDEFRPAFADIDLPIIDGLVPDDTRGLTVDGARAELAADLINALEVRPGLAARVSQVDVWDPYDAIVLLNDDPTLIHLGHERFVQRLEEYLELVPALRTRVPHIDYVDMRFEHRVYVRPRDPSGGSDRRRGDGFIGMTSAGNQ